MPVEEQPINETVEVSDSDLARAWLDREMGETRQRLKDAEFSQRFHETYQPKFRARPSYIEPGSMDAEDWDIAEWEDQHWPEEQQARLDELEVEIENLNDKSSDLFALRQRLDREDPLAIAELAAQERARRVALKEQERLRIERQQGVSFEGTDEVIGEIKVLDEAVKTGAFKNGETVHGWNRIYISKSGYTYVYQDGRGPLGGYVASIAIHKEKDEIKVSYEDLSQMEARRTPGGIQVKNEGIGLFFRIKSPENKVKDHFAIKVGLGFRFEDHGPLEVKSKGVDFEMTQGHFDQFRNHLTSLVGDAKTALPSK